MILGVIGAAEPESTILILLEV